MPRAATNAGFWWYKPKRMTPEQLGRMIEDYVEASGKTKKQITDSADLPNKVIYNVFKGKATMTSLIKILEQIGVEIRFKRI